MSSKCNNTSRGNANNKRSIENQINMAVNCSVLLCCCYRLTSSSVELEFCLVPVAVPVDLCGDVLELALPFVSAVERVCLRTVTPFLPLIRFCNFSVEVTIGSFLSLICMTSSISNCDCNNESNGVNTSRLCAAGNGRH